MAHGDLTFFGFTGEYFPRSFNLSDHYLLQNTVLSTDVDTNPKLVVTNIVYA